MDFNNFSSTVEPSVEDNLLLRQIDTLKHLLHVDPDETAEQLGRPSELAAKTKQLNRELNIDLITTQRHQFLLPSQQRLLDFREDRRKSAIEKYYVQKRCLEQITIWRKLALRLSYCKLLRKRADWHFYRSHAFQFMHTIYRRMVLRCRIVAYEFPRLRQASEKSFYYWKKKTCMARMMRMVMYSYTETLVHFRRFVHKMRWNLVISHHERMVQRKVMSEDEIMSRYFLLKWVRMRRKQLVSYEAAYNFGRRRLFAFFMMRLCGRIVISRQSQLNEKIRVEKLKRRSFMKLQLRAYFKERISCALMVYFFKHVQKHFQRFIGWWKSSIVQITSVDTAKYCFAKKSLLKLKKLMWIRIKYSVFFEEIFQKTIVCYNVPRRMVWSDEDGGDYESVNSSEDFDDYIPAIASKRWVRHLLLKRGLTRFMRNSRSQRRSDALADEHKARIRKRRWFSQVIEYQKRQLEHRQKHGIIQYHAAKTNTSADSASRHGGTEHHSHSSKHKKKATSTRHQNPVTLAKLHCETTLSQTNTSQKSANQMGQLSPLERHHERHRTGKVARDRRHECHYPQCQDHYETYWSSKLFVKWMEFVSNVRADRIVRDIKRKRREEELKLQAERVYAEQQSQLRTIVTASPHQLQQSEAPAPPAIASSALISVTSSVPPSQAAAVNRRPTPRPESPGFPLPPAQKAPVLETPPVLPVQTTSRRPTPTPIQATAAIPTLLATSLNQPITVEPVEPAHSSSSDESLSYHPQRGLSPVQEETENEEQETESAPSPIGKKKGWGLLKSIVTGVGFEEPNKSKAESNSTESNDTLSTDDKVSSVGAEVDIPISESSVVVETVSRDFAPISPPVADFQIVDTASPSYRAASPDEVIKHTRLDRFGSPYVTYETVHHHKFQACDDDGDEYADDTDNSLGGTIRQWHKEQGKQVNTSSNRRYGKSSGRISHSHFVGGSSQYHMQRSSKHMNYEDEDERPPIDAKSALELASGYHEDLLLSGALNNVVRNCIKHSQLAKLNHLANVHFFYPHRVRSFYRQWISYVENHSKVSARINHVSESHLMRKYLSVMRYQFRYYMTCVDKHYHRVQVAASKVNVTLYPPLSEEEIAAEVSQMEPCTRNAVILGNIIPIGCGLLRYFLLRWRSNTHRYNIALDKYDLGRKSHYQRLAAVGLSMLLYPVMRNKYNLSLHNRSLVCEKILLFRKMVHTFKSFMLSLKEHKEECAGVDRTILAGHKKHYGLMFFVRNLRIHRYRVRDVQNDLVEKGMVGFKLFNFHKFGGHIRKRYILKTFGEKAHRHLMLRHIRNIVSRYSVFYIQLNRAEQLMDMALKYYRYLILNQYMHKWSYFNAARKEQRADLWRSKSAHKKRKSKKSGSYSSTSASLSPKKSAFFVQMTVAKSIALWMERAQWGTRIRQLDAESWRLLWRRVKYKFFSYGEMLQQSKICDALADMHYREMKLPRVVMQAFICNYVRRTTMRAWENTANKFFDMHTFRKCFTALADNLKSANLKMQHTIDFKYDRDCGNVMKLWRYYAASLSTMRQLKFFVDAHHRKQQLSVAVKILSGRHVVVYNASVTMGNIIDILEDGAESTVNSNTGSRYQKMLDGRMVRSHHQLQSECASLSMIAVHHFNTVVLRESLYVWQDNGKSLVLNALNRFPRSDMHYHLYRTRTALSSLLYHKEARQYQYTLNIIVFRLMEDKQRNVFDVIKRKINRRIEHRIELEDCDAECRLRKLRNVFTVLRHRVSLNTRNVLDACIYRYKASPNRSTIVPMVGHNRRKSRFFKVLRNLAKMTKLLLDVKEHRDQRQEAILKTRIRGKLVKWLERCKKVNKNGPTYNLSLLLWKRKKYFYQLRRRAAGDTPPAARRSSSLTSSIASSATKAQSWITATASLRKFFSDNKKLGQMEKATEQFLLFSSRVWFRRKAESVVPRRTSFEHALFFRDSRRCRLALKYWRRYKHIVSAFRGVQHRRMSKLLLFWKGYSTYVEKAKGTVHRLIRSYLHQKVEKFFDCWVFDTLVSRTCDEGIIRKKLQKKLEVVDKLLSMVRDHRRRNNKLHRIAGNKGYSIGGTSTSEKAVLMSPARRASCPFRGSMTHESTLLQYEDAPTIYAQNRSVRIHWQYLNLWYENILHHQHMKEQANLFRIHSMKRKAIFLLCVLVSESHSRAIQERNTLDICLSRRLSRWRHFCRNSRFARTTLAKVKTGEVEGTLQRALARLRLSKRLSRKTKVIVHDYDAKRRLHMLRRAFQTFDAAICARWASYHQLRVLDYRYDRSSLKRRFHQFRTSIRQFINKRMSRAVESTTAIDVEEVDEVNDSNSEDKENIFSLMNQQRKQHRIINRSKSAMTKESSEIAELCAFFGYDTACSEDLYGFANELTATGGYSAVIKDPLFPVSKHRKPLELVERSEGQDNPPLIPHTNDENERGNDSSVGGSLAAMGEKVLTVGLSIKEVAPVAVEGVTVCVDVPSESPPEGERKSRKSWGLLRSIVTGIGFVPPEETNAGEKMDESNEHGVHNESDGKVEASDEIDSKFLQGSDKDVESGKISDTNDGVCEEVVETDHTDSLVTEKSTGLTVVSNLFARGSVTYPPMPSMPINATFPHHPVANQASDMPAFSPSSVSSTAASVRPSLAEGALYAIREDSFDEDDDSVCTSPPKPVLCTLRQIVSSDVDSIAAEEDSEDGKNESAV